MIDNVVMLSQVKKLTIRSHLKIQILIRYLHPLSKENLSGSSHEARAEAAQATASTQMAKKAWPQTLGK
jgi:hypothetical protein